MCLSTTANLTASRQTLALCHSESTFKEPCFEAIFKMDNSPVISDVSTVPAWFLCTWVRPDHVLAMGPWAPTDVNDPRPSPQCHCPFPSELSLFIRIMACSPTITPSGYGSHLQSFVLCSKLQDPPHVSSESPFVDTLSTCCYSTYSGDHFNVLKPQTFKPTISLLQERTQINEYLEIILYECVWERERVTLVNATDDTEWPYGPFPACRSALGLLH